MKLFKRIRIQMQSGMNTLLDSVENHEAAAEGVLREARECLARCEVRASRVRAEAERINQRLEAAREKVEQWTTRASDYAKANRERALECLRRKRSAEAELKQLETEANEHAALEDKLESHLSQARKQVTELNQKRSLLAARDCVAKTSAQAGSTGADEDALRVFDRWEEKVRASEICEDLTETSGKDRFERALDEAETEASLEAELDQLNPPQTSKKGQ